MTINDLKGITIEVLKLQPLIFGMTFTIAVFATFFIN